MSNRRPPHWDRTTDHLAKDCGVETVSFSGPMPTGLTCHYCDDVATNRDHIVPDSVGGARLWWNLVPSCEPCNNSKADRQACSCMFCVRAIALWSLGFRREGKSYREKKHGAAERAARTKKKPTPTWVSAPPLALSSEQIAKLSELKFS